jgi:hypothetical protein
MKASEALAPQVKWLKDRCKQIKEQLDTELKSRSIWCGSNYGDQLKSRLDECVAIKISTEKYMKKLRHEGN